MTTYERIVFILGSAGFGYMLHSVSGFLFGMLWAFLVTFILALLSRSN